MIMGKPGNIHGSGAVAGDEERQPLRGGGSLETERASASSRSRGAAAAGSGARACAAVWCSAC
jgi:hypothetical protein